MTTTRVADLKPGQTFIHQHPINGLGRTSRAVKVRTIQFQNFRTESGVITRRARINSGGHGLIIPADTTVELETK